MGGPRLEPFCDDQNGLRKKRKNMHLKIRPVGNRTEDRKHFSKIIDL